MRPFIEAQKLEPSLNQGGEADTRGQAEETAARKALPFTETRGPQG